MVYDGPDDSGTGTNYCDSSVPSLVQSADSSLYIVYTSTDAGNSFKGAWEKVESKNICPQFDLKAFFHSYLLRQCPTDVDQV